MAVVLTTIVILLLVGVDQLTKYLVLTNLKSLNAVTVIDGILQFRYVENTGAAFSMFSDNTFLLAVATSLIMLGVIVWIAMGKVESKLEYAALTLIVAGGVGNLLDRLFRGFVVDFIEFTFVNYAVFNFADVLITVGVVLFVIYIVKDTIREIKESKEKEQDSDE